MRSVRSALLSLAIAVLLLADGRAQTPASDDAGPASKWQADLAARPDGWRYKFHNGHWWYYHADATWSVWDGSWIPFRSRTAARSSAAVSYSASLPNTLQPAPQGGNVAWQSYSLVPLGGRQMPVAPWVGPLASGMGISATDALPGRSNPQMAGGGIGVYGGEVLSGRNGGLPNIGGGTISRRYIAGGRSLSATDALPGRLNRQMAGGGLGLYGSPEGLSSAGAPGLRSSGSIATDALPGQRDPQMSGGGLGIYGQ